MRTIEELIDLKEPGWDLVSEWLNDAKNEYNLAETNFINLELE